MLNYPDRKPNFSDSCFKDLHKKLKPGDLLQINNALDFLMRGSKSKDHFDLYVPLLEKTIVLTLRPVILCGDYRFGCHHKNIIDNMKEFPKFYKNLQSYDIFTPLTPCVEVLYGKDILYLECELFLKAVDEGWVSIISNERK